MNMFIADRHRLGLVFQDFDANAVRRLDEGLVYAVVAARKHVHARSLPLRGPLLDVVHDEADMVHHRTLSGPSPFSVPSTRLIKTPGNMICGFAPGINLPPMARKSFLFASTSFDAMCQ